MRKKAVCLLTVLLLGFPMGALAADEDYGDESVTGGHEILYNVSFPADIHAYLDPGDLSGRGQIFSDHYIIENHGNTDIIIKIKNISIYDSYTEDIYEFSEEEILDDHSHIKKLNVDMVWENEEEQIKKVLHVSEGEPEEYVLYLAASQYGETEEAVVSEGSSVGNFYFTGTLSSDPGLVWEDDEIIVRFEYEIISPEHDEMRAAAKELLGTAWDDADRTGMQGTEESEERFFSKDTVEGKNPEETDSKIGEESNGSLMDEDTILKGETAGDNKEQSKSENKTPEETAEKNETSGEGERIPEEEESAVGKDPFSDGDQTAEEPETPDAEDTALGEEGTAVGKDPFGDGDQTAEEPETPDAEDTALGEEGTAVGKDPFGDGDQTAEKPETPDTEDTALGEEGTAVGKDPFADGDQTAEESETPDTEDIIPKAEGSVVRKEPSGYEN